VVGTYLVWGVWFPSHFSIGGNESYPDYWVITGDLQYPRYKTPTVTPSLLSSRWKNGVVGTATGFGAVIMGLRASMIRFQNPMVVPTM
jgi:hypothetical protein